MNTASYIPGTDAGFNDWLLNFSTLITANPTTYGLVAADATAIANQQSAFATAYSLAKDPSTRTPATVASKDAIKAQALYIVRPYAMKINANQAVTNEQRAALGLTVRKTVPTPVPAPSSAPALALNSAIPGVVSLGYSDTAAPAGKAKPYGVTHLLVYRAVGIVPAIDPSQAVFQMAVTKSPFALPVEPAITGKVITVFTRWQTKSGPGGVAQLGPWSAPIVFNGM